MLPRQISCAAIAAAVTLSVSAANAQYYGDGCSNCAPIAVATCTPIQPVQTTCYQTVPVTTYHREEQTVRVPYYKTSYEDREVTVMRPETTQREVEVPTVSYQSVTEYRTVNRDMGRWVTQYNPVRKFSPCQVDARPGVIGWLNRTGYSFRSAFTPNYTTARKYVPQLMTCSVPVTRQVAIQGTRRVSVNETRMVAERKTERIPVQKLAWKEETRTVMRPQTAYRTVPIGTRLAYGYGGYGIGGTTAFAPTIQSRTALGPTPDPISRERTARSEKAPFPDDEEGYDRERRRTSADDKHLHRSSHSHELEPTPSLRTFQDDSDSGDDDAPDIFQGVNNRRRQSDSVVVPATYRREKKSDQASTGWKRASSGRTATRGSSTSRKSAVTLTQKSGN